MTEIKVEGIEPLPGSGDFVIEPSNNNHENGETDDPDAPCIDIIINNVVCTFSTRCHLNLKTVALEGANVEYKREQNVSTQIAVTYHWFNFFVSLCLIFTQI